MEAGDGETRLTRRALSEARSRGRSTTIDNPVASNPFAVLTTQSVETCDSDGDSENELTEDILASQATSRAPKPKRAYVAKTTKQKTAITDTIVVAPDGEDRDTRPKRHPRKLSAKAKQNEANQDVVGAGRTNGWVGVDEQAVQENIQEQMNEQTGILKTLLREWMKQDAHNKKMEAKLTLLEKELEAVKGECRAVKEELYKTKQQMADGMAALVSGNSSPNPSYAEVARTPPTSQPSNMQTLSSFNTTPSNFTNTLYCTIDTSRVEAEVSGQISAGTIRAMVENGMRSKEENATWRCRAVTMDPRNPHRIRIACRDEDEHKTVKQTVEANLVQGARILRDDLYPIRVDSVNRTAVLDETGNIRTGATEALSEENDTQVAKIAWLSNRDIPKTYGSMLVYLNKRSDAQRFLREGFFYAGGESGYTKMFEHRDRPKQCYNCQEVTNHKAYQCNKTKICGKCAKEGHHHSECTETIFKCVPCGGPHESFSRNCRKLYPSQHE